MIERARWGKATLTTQLVELVIRKRRVMSSSPFSDVNYGFSSLIQRCDAT